MEVIIDGIPSTKRAHQIQAPTIGFDRKLYVNVADGAEWTAAQNARDLRGKVLRLNQDGTIPWDNPDPNSPVYAKGFRNPFGAAWRASDQSLYIAGNGPDTDDRIARVEPYGNYGWPGSMRKNSIFWWHNCQAPTALAFMQGGQFPAWFNDDLFVALFGESYRRGRGEKGKRIVKIRLNKEATAVKSYDDFAVYVGDGPASPCGLAFGPDGLYFTDLHGEGEAGDKHASGHIYRIVPDQEAIRAQLEKANDYARIWAGGG